jgi:molecular chaperone GrpE (heat shock protein)
MNDETLPSYPGAEKQPPVPPPSNSTIGASSIYRLCEEIIALRETNHRQHKLFEQTLAKTRDGMQSSFNSFAADTQRAYQQLRQEVHGEKRISLALLNELMELGFDLERIVSARPSAADANVVGGWMETVAVESRKVQAALSRFGLQPYDAVIGSAYNPALHERVGSKRVEGMDALRVAEQIERGYASQQPEFVLRRPKVIVTE